MHIRIRPVFILKGLTKGLLLGVKQLIMTSAPSHVNQSLNWANCRWNKGLSKIKPSLTLKKHLNLNNVDLFNPILTTDKIPKDRRITRLLTNLDLLLQINKVNFQDTFRHMQPVPARLVKTGQQSQNTHYQVTLLPIPCHIHLNLGILNVYHWVWDCFFGKQNSKCYQPNTQSKYPKLVS